MPSVLRASRIYLSDAETLKLAEKYLSPTAGFSLPDVRGGILGSSASRPASRRRPDALRWRRWGLAERRKAAVARSRRVFEVGDAERLFALTFWPRALAVMTASSPTVIVAGDALLPARLRAADGDHAAETDLRKRSASSPTAGVPIWTRLSIFAPRAMRVSPTRRSRASAAPSPLVLGERAVCGISAIASHLSVAKAVRATTLCCG